MLRPLFLILACCFLWTLTAQNDDCSFGLVVNSVTAAVGEEVSVDVTARQYNGIVGMQYSHTWNPAKLRFIEIIYNPDTDITAVDFNLDPAFLDQGILNFVYLESTTQGLSLPDGEVLYTIRFELLDSGETSVDITPLGGVFEIVDNSFLPLQNFFALHGKIGPNSYPTVTSACLNGQACNNPDLGRIAVLPSGTEPLNLVWSNEQGYSGNGTEITGLNSGVYQLDLTDANGSTTNGDFYLGSETGLTVDLSVDADQCGGLPDGAVSTVVSGGSGNYSYAWSNGATTSEISAVSAGDYQLTVTDLDLGCSISTSVTVPSFTPLIGFFNASNPSCGGSADGELTLFVDGPSNLFPVTYEWSNGATTAELTGLEGGLYTVTVTDVNDCEAYFSYILESDELDFEVEVIPGDCQVTGGTISIQLDPEDYTFNWSTGATAPTVMNLADGSYSVTVTENSTGCSTVATYNMVNEELITSWSQECFLVDDEYMSDLSIALWNPTDGPYLFNWSNGASETAEQFSTITVPATGNYSVTITSAGGCETVVNDIIPMCGGAGVQLYLDPSTVEMVDGQNQCFSLRANGFEGIGGLQLTLNWDESKLDFTNLGQLHLPGLTNANFNTNLSSDGLVSVSWLSSDVINGHTLNNGSPLFEICLTANTAQETNTSLGFTTFPTPLEVTHIDLSILPTTTQAALIALNGGGTGTQDMELFIEDVQTNTGEQFCTSVVASQLNDVIGMQATLSWDPTALEFIGTANLSLPDMSGSVFGNIAEAQLEGRLRFLWVENNLQGINTIGTTQLFDMCFVATGEPGTYPINMGLMGDPLPLEVVNGSFQQENVSAQSGTVTIVDQADEFVSLEILSTAASFGEEICVPVRAVAFSQVVGMQFSINWDNNRVSFSELVLPDNALELQVGDFNILPEEGKLSMAWVSDQLDPVSLAPETVLFELCYTTQTTPGPAGIIFASQPTSIEFVSGDDVIPFVPVNGTIMVTEEGLVWPGDTNSDGIANNLDVLPLGLAFGATGPQRSSATTSWLAQYAAPWSGATPESLVNFRHADTNGDGVISAVDTLALNLNWGQTADGIGGNSEQTNFLTGAPLFVLADTLQAGVQASLPIMLGNEELIENAYGLAFTLRYDPDVVEAGSVKIRPAGWLFNGEDEHLCMFRDYPADGRTEVALVRTDGVGVAGQGQVAELVIIMEDVILRGLVDIETYFRLEDVRFITAGELPIPTSPRETEILVEGVTSTKEPEWTNAIELSPNPTTGLTQLEVGQLEVDQLQLLDPHGKLLWSTDEFTGAIDLNALPAGTYFLKIGTTAGVVYEKIVKL